MDAATVATTAVAVRWGLAGVAVGFVGVAFAATAARWVLVGRLLTLPLRPMARPFLTVLVPTVASIVAGQPGLAALAGAGRLAALAVRVPSRPCRPRRCCGWSRAASSATGSASSPCRSGTPGGSADGCAWTLEAGTGRLEAATGRSALRPRTHRRLDREAKRVRGNQVRRSALGQLPHHLDPTPSTGFDQVVTSAHRGNREAWRGSSRSFVAARGLSYP